LAKHYIYNYKGTGTRNGLQGLGAMHWTWAKEDGYYKCYDARGQEYSPTCNRNLEAQKLSD